MLDVNTAFAPTGLAWENSHCKQGWAHFFGILRMPESWEQVRKLAGILGATAYEASLMVNSGDCLFKTEAADPQNGFSHAQLATQTSALPAWALGFPRERLLWPSACS